MALSFSVFCTLNVNIRERSCQGGSASSILERSGFQISARTRISVCFGGCYDNNMTPQVPAACHKDAFGGQLPSVALSVFMLCVSVSASRSDCITPVTKTSESASIAEPSGRLSAKDVRVVHHDLIPRFFVFVVNYWLLQSVWPVLRTCLLCRPEVYRDLNKVSALILKLLWNFMYSDAKQVIVFAALIQNCSEAFEHPH
jgi:hypothetical protein